MVLFFPDNTVLVNFAVIGRVDLLAALSRGNGRWCLTVAGECAASARVPGLESLVGVGQILGRPWEPTPAERLMTTVYRERMAQPGDERHMHAGEAETVAVIVGPRTAADGDLRQR